MISRIIWKNDEDALYFIPIFPIFLLAMVLYVLLSSLVLAESNPPLEIKARGESEVRLGVETASGSFVKVRGDRFEIRAELTSFDGSHLMLAGQTILIDPALVKKYRQKGILNIGDRVKVTGVVRSGTKIAEDVMSLGEGQGRFQLELENRGLGDSAAVGLGTSQTLQNQVRIKANGSVEPMVSFLEQILTYLRSLMSGLVSP